MGGVGSICNSRIYGIGKVSGNRIYCEANDIKQYYQNKYPNIIGAAASEGRKVDYVHYVNLSFTFTTLKIKPKLSFSNIWKSINPFSESPEVTYLKPPTMKEQYEVGIEYLKEKNYLDKVKITISGDRLTFKTLTEKEKEELKIKKKIENNLSEF